MNLPYWLLCLLPMWDYICPSCKREVKLKSHTCPFCGENYGVSLRIPPHILKDKQMLETYVHGKIFPSISAEQRRYLTQYFTTFFSDNFDGESSAFERWDTLAIPAGCTLEVQNIIKYAGTDAMHAISTWSNAVYAQKQITQSNTTYTRCYLQHISLPINGDYCFHTGYLGAVTIAGGQIGLIDDGGTVKWLIGWKDAILGWQWSIISPPSAIEALKWYCTELHQYTDPGNGVVSFTLDGSVIKTITGITNAVGDNPMYMGAGIRDSGGGPFEVYVDELVVADAYIGPEVAKTYMTFMT